MCGGLCASFVCFKNLNYFLWKATEKSGARKQDRCTPWKQDGHMPREQDGCTPRRQDGWTPRKQLHGSGEASQRTGSSEGRQCGTYPSKGEEVWMPGWGHSKSRLAMRKELDRAVRRDFPVLPPSRRDTGNIIHCWKH